MPVPVTGGSVLEDGQALRCGVRRAETARGPVPVDGRTASALGTVAVAVRS